MWHGIQNVKFKGPLQSGHENTATMSYGRHKYRSSPIFDVTNDKSAADALEPSG